MSLSTQLASYGIDYSDAVNRFGGNSALYQRLALKYLDDEHVAALTAAIEMKDYDTAYRHAHALKGVSGNLSFKRLYELSGDLCKMLRDGAPELAEHLLPELIETHKRVLQGLIALQENPCIQ